MRQLKISFIRAGLPGDDSRIIDEDKNPGEACQEEALVYWSRYGNNHAFSREGDHFTARVFEIADDKTGACINGRGKEMKLLASAKLDKSGLKLVSPSQPWFPQS